MPHEHQSLQIHANNWPLPMSIKVRPYVERHTMSRDRLAVQIFGASNKQVYRVATRQQSL
jgi:hypothetical protein